jgi:integrase
MQGTITKALISQQKDIAKATKSTVTIWDAGLGCRISPKGRVSWLLKAYLGDGGRGARQVKYRFGRYPDLEIDEARKKAGALRVDVERGIHLGAEKRKQRRKQHAVFETGTLKGALLAYTQLHRTQKGNYWIDLAGRIDLKDDKGNPALAGIFGRIVNSIGKDTLIGNVTKSDINELIKAKQIERKKGAARMLYAALSPFFKWCVSEEYIPSNPMDGITAPKTVKSRERYLSPDEIKILWSTSLGIPYPFGPFYRLLLLTAQRRDEVAGMSWSELNLEDNIWTIPGSRTKNGKEHIVHLSHEALAIINDIPKSDGSKLVFRSGRKDKETPISAFSDAKEELDKAMGIPAWRLHDLRRTFDTLSAENDLANDHVIDAALNHTKAGLRKVYNRAQYLSQRRQLFKAWGEYIDNLVSPKADQPKAANVIAFPAA